MKLRTAFLRFVLSPRVLTITPSLSYYYLIYISHSLARRRGDEKVLPGPRKTSDLYRYNGKMNENSRRASALVTLAPFPHPLPPRSFFLTGESDVCKHEQVDTMV